MNTSQTAIPAFDQLKAGDALPPLQLPPVNRTTLALFAGASGDHNPIHIDIDFARRAGMPDVFAHGMLGMAWLGRLLTQWMPHAQVRRFDVRFLGITQIGHVITCSGQVRSVDLVNGERQVRVEVQSANQYNEVRIPGDALLVARAAPG